ncbi:hypothetical protein GGX14DRAFT_384697 [Mycena pura]|uniref:Uncharacterized protein n=1 Tax=Mycena pura TaxID=153505 RepID=A0AAD6YS96_9AGAR|nr:hypothetical protein GGX14DRAFT_384697 [Mycena pura]
MAECNASIARLTLLPPAPAAAPAENDDASGTAASSSPAVPPHCEYFMPGEWPENPLFLLNLGDSDLALASVAPEDHTLMKKNVRDFAIPDPLPGNNRYWQVQLEVALMPYITHSTPLTGPTFLLCARQCATLKPGASTKASEDLKQNSSRRVTSRPRPMNTIHSKKPSIHSSPILDLIEERLGRPLASLFSLLHSLQRDGRECSKLKPRFLCRREGNVSCTSMVKPLALVLSLRTE